VKPAKKPSPLFWVALAVTGLGSLALGLLVWFLPPEQGYAWMARGWGRGAGAGGFGMGHMNPLPMILGFLFVVFVISMLVRRGRHGHHGWHHGHHGPEGHGHPMFADPLSDLAEAYAEGKITREQYLERKAVLEENR